MFNPASNNLPAVVVTGQLPQAPHLGHAHGAKRVAPSALVVRLDDHRPRPDHARAEPGRAERAPRSSTGTFGLGYDHATFAALDRPGPSLAFAAQAYIQATDPGASVPPAFAAAAYQAVADRRFGFMGLLDPLDFRA